MTTDQIKKAKSKIYKVFDIIDPSGKNTQKYKDLFEPMDDKQFEKFMKGFMKDEEANFRLELVPFEIKADMKRVTQALDYINVPLTEHVAIPSSNEMGEPIVTNYPVIVGYSPIKRLQQHAIKKNKASIHTSQRNPRTGQVIGADKGGRSSDMENISLLALDAPNTLKEILGPKSDDMEMKASMNQQIQEKGYFSLDEMVSRKVNKVALNTLDVLFLSAGIKTNLITDGLYLTKTLKNQNDKTSSTLSQDKIREV